MPTVTGVNLRHRPGGIEITGVRALVVRALVVWALVQSRNGYPRTTAPAGSVTAYGRDGLGCVTSARETAPTRGVDAS